MAILPIVQYPAAILEEKCERVTEFNQELGQLLDNMIDTMIDADGVGLAAPQIGIRQQIAVVEIDENEMIELINPEIVEKKGEEIDVEGCLSFPELYGTVARSYTIEVTAQNRFGEPFKLEAEGFLSRAIQHELDHLAGVLFTSKIIEYVDEEEVFGREEA
ncbi:peptide deformylase [Bacillus sp. FJAT-50079]|uniref:peptide deformylase n=1 Tax=Bacillus sp. FJAT-50079 TaxID=2833577 RepID=UPI001BC9303C|nr:peptide deformylase [Bacillus sp. FJAT-50079]MBS4207673.1 peptide deformylase [Bacillus sp. FJAT-50079]